MRAWTSGLLVLAVALTLASAPATADSHLEKFIGAFVGSGAATVDGGAQEQRDLDVTVEPYKDGGFTLKWITVVRAANGERTGDDVRRREVEENFVPVEDRENVFVLDGKGGLFQKAETPDPMKGDPIRWAAIEDDAMTVYSMAVGPGGGAELHVYRRTLTEKGMAVSFLRLQDERVAVEMSGELVRTR